MTTTVLHLVAANAANDDDDLLLIDRSLKNMACQESGEMDL
jgi:hypothetical protein